MTILLIDTSQPVATVSLVRDKKIVKRSQWRADRALGNQLLAAIDSVLKEQGLALEEVDRIGVIKGPGHYSAIRTGIVTATMLAAAKKVPLVAIPAGYGEAVGEVLSAAIPQRVITPVYSSI